MYTAERPTSVGYQALLTAAHDSIPVVYVIFNNASNRILKQRTLALKGFSAEVGLAALGGEPGWTDQRGVTCCGTDSFHVRSRPVMTYVYR